MNWIAIFDLVCMERGLANKKFELEELRGNTAYEYMASNMESLEIAFISS